MLRFIRMMILLAGLVTACYAEDPMTDFPEHCPSNTDFIWTSIKLAGFIPTKGFQLKEELKDKWEIGGNIPLSHSQKSIPENANLEVISISSRMECRYQLSANTMAPSTMTLRSKNYINCASHFPNFLSDSCKTTADNPTVCSWKYNS